MCLFCMEGGAGVGQGKAEGEGVVATLYREFVWPMTRS
jgi:hypothetical protein